MSPNALQERVVLVDTDDESIGDMEKLEAHRRGVLHRAFSVFIFTSDHKIFLQRRAAIKYHSGGLWTNTCCGHPRPGEAVEAAASRRLKEEMGIDCPLEEIFSFIYKSTFDDGLIEHELDHVFVGKSDTTPDPDRNEVWEWKTLSLDGIREEMTSHPDLFTSWFRICFERMAESPLLGSVGQE